MVPSSRPYTDSKSDKTTNCQVLDLAPPRPGSYRASLLKACSLTLMAVAVWQGY